MGRYHALRLHLVILLRILCVIGLAVIAGGQLAGVDWVTTLQGVSGSYMGPILKLAVATPLTYHYLGAVRHAVRYIYLYIACIVFVIYDMLYSIGTIHRRDWRRRR